MKILIGRTGDARAGVLSNSGLGACISKFLAPGGCRGCPCHVAGSCVGLVCYAHARFMTCAGRVRKRTRFEHAISGIHSADPQRTRRGVPMDCTNGQAGLLIYTCAIPPSRRALARSICSIQLPLLKAVTHEL